MDQELSVNIPAKLNLFDMVSIPPFVNSPEGKQALGTIKSKKRGKRAVKLFLWLALIVFVTYKYFTGQGFLAIAIIGGIILLIYSIVSSSGGSNNDYVLQKAKGDHCKKVVEELVTKNFPGSVYFYYEDNALIYNNELCAYVSTRTGLLVIYHNSNINNININRVLTNKFGGVVTYHDSGTASVKQGYLHEYRMEIITNFLECPIISITVDDTPNYYNELKKAMAVLSG